MSRAGTTASKGVGSRTPWARAIAVAAADPAWRSASGAPPARAYTSARMVMVGHSRRLAQPLTRGQQRVIAVVVVALLAVATLAITRSSSAPVSRNGCVSIVMAGSMGGGLLQQCGAAARTLCQTEFARIDMLARLIQPQCRLAGLQPRRN